MGKRGAGGGQGTPTPGAPLSHPQGSQEGLGWSSPVSQGGPQGLGGCPFPQGVPIVPEGSLVPGKGSPSLRGGPTHPTGSVMSPSVPITAPKCLGGFPLPQGIPIPPTKGWGGSPFHGTGTQDPLGPPPNAPTAPTTGVLPSRVSLSRGCPPAPQQGFPVSGVPPCSPAGFHCLGESPPAWGCPPIGLTPTHLAALAGAHSVVVPGAAVAAHEARLVHAGGGRRRGGARVPQNPPRGGLQGWGGKRRELKSPSQPPSKRGAAHVGGCVEETRAQGG